MTSAHGAQEIMTNLRNLTRSDQGCLHPWSRPRRVLPTFTAVLATSTAVPAPSRPGELHPQPLTDPYVSLSTHTARVIQRRPTTSFIQIEGFFPLPVDRNESIMNRMTRPLRSTGVTQLHRYYEAVCPWCEPRYFRSHGLSTCTFSLTISRPGSHVSHWSPYQGHAACTPAAV